MATIPLIYAEGYCYANAYINRLHYYKEKKLKMVYGSLGVNGFFEFGGKDWKKEQFQAKIDGFRTDSHCWLEDEEGNVYDCLFKEYDAWAIVRTCRRMKRRGILEGVSKAELLRDGIEYVPAPLDAQIALVRATASFVKDAYARVAKKFNVEL